MGFNDLNSGYVGFSMSRRAVQAYSDGAMPLSKWTKKAILDKAYGLYKENKCTYRFELLTKLSLAQLKNLLLTMQGWHHTSAYINRTSFYDVCEAAVCELTDSKIREMISDGTADVTPETPVRNRGNFRYIEWSGTRAHPKATGHELRDVMVETRGSFYYVYDNDDSLIVKKKIGSNGTRFISAAELERDRQRAEKAGRQNQYMLTHSDPKAIDFYNELVSEGFSRSASGKFYKNGRKPSPADYETGLDKFFKTGEHRLVQDGPEDATVLVLETWDGFKWTKE